MITYIKSPFHITLTLTTQTHSFLILNIIIMDVKLWDLNQFVDSWNSAYPAILLPFLPRFKHILFSSLSSLNHRHHNWEGWVLFHPLQHGRKNTYSRQRVNDIFRKPGHPLRYLSFWVHKVGLRASVNEPLCDPSRPCISRMETVRQKTGNISRKDNVSVELNYGRYVLPVYSCFLENQWILLELSEIYRGEWDVIITPIFRGFAGNSAGLKWCIISDYNDFPLCNLPQI